MLGGIADSVHEVIELDPGNIIPHRGLPCVGEPISSRGWGNVVKTSIIMLDVNAVFSSEELALVSGAADAADQPVLRH